MSDLVESLRRTSFDCCQQAANKIEKLEERNEALEAALREIERACLVPEIQVMVRAALAPEQDKMSDADEYEKRIREKVFNANILTNGEWVYLVGMFSTMREIAEYCYNDGGTATEMTQVARAALASEPDK